MKTEILSKEPLGSGFIFKTNAQTRVSKKDFKFALLREINGKWFIFSLANSTARFNSALKNFYISHAVALETETGKVLFEHRATL